MSIGKARLLAEMGIKPVWRLREPLTLREAQVETQAQVQGHASEPVEDIASAGAPLAETSSATFSVPHPAAGLDWPGLESSVADCRACGLCERRKQAVLGVGDRHAEWMFVGEGPGAEEDERGEPFVGQAGKLLDAMLEAVSLRRDTNVYIANTVKCRPPGNRTPEATEIAACLPYLERQIALVKPKLLVALGRPAAQALLGDEVSIAAARKNLHSYAGVPVVVTYHPACLLRNLPDKAKAWEDLCFAVDAMARLSD